MTDHARTSLRIAVPMTLLVALLFATGLLVDRRQTPFSPIASCVTIAVVLVLIAVASFSVWNETLRNRARREAEARAAREALAKRGVRRKRRGRFGVSSPDVRAHKHMPWYHGGLRD